MRTLSINLASAPFRRDRPFEVAALAGATVLVAVLGLLVFTIYIRHQEAQQAREARVHPLLVGDILVERPVGPGGSRLGAWLRRGAALQEIVQRRNFISVPARWRHTRRSRSPSNGRQGMADPAPRQWG